MSISNKIKSAHSKVTSPREPLWKGPEIDGITFSMLSRFLVCRERFRVYFIEGLQSQNAFNQRLEYGNMWHVCEESYHSEVRHFGEYVGTTIWEDELKQYCENLAKTYPTAGEQIKHWWNVCNVQFPIYLNYWESSKDNPSKRYQSLLNESVFDVPYKLPSGRMIRLRGKWDSLFMDKKGGLWLQEHKTKGDIQPEQLRRQLTYDLQTMMYLIALQTWQELDDYGIPIRTPATVQPDITGILYNVVRRPLSGGRHSIRQHAPTKSNPRGESSESFYNRLKECIESEPEYFFMRWEVPITQQDIEKFRIECLNPILEQLVDWYEFASSCIPEINRDNLYKSSDGIHWRHPFGVYNVLDEGGSSDLDQYLTDGNPTGLQRVDKLFPELQ